MNANKDRYIFNIIFSVEENEVRIGIEDLENVNVTIEELKKELHKKECIGVDFLKKIKKENSIKNIFEKIYFQALDCIPVIILPFAFVSALIIALHIVDKI